MSAITAGSNAVSFLFGLNLDRLLFVGAVIAALFAAATVVSLGTSGSTFI